MKQLIIISNLVFLFFSLQAYADNGKNSCKNLKHGFNLLLEVNDSSLNKTLWLVANNGPYTALWTSDETISNRIFLGDDIIKGRNNRIWIKYEPLNNNKRAGKKNKGKKGNNKSGVFYYHVQKNGVWGEPKVETVDFTGFSTSFYWQKENLSSLHCLQNSEPLPEPVIPPLNYCDLFPSPVQTWHQDGTLNVSHGGPDHFARIENAYKGKYVGFKDDYQLEVVSESCLLADGSLTQCLTDSSLMVEKADLEPFKAAMSVLPSPSSSNFGELQLYPGAYSSLPDGYTSYNFAPGEYWIQHIALAGNEKLNFTSDEKTVLHTQSMQISGNVQINHIGTPDNLLIIGHGETNALIALSSNNTFHALIYSEKMVDLSGNVVIKGAVTAKIVKVKLNARIIGESQCFIPSPEDNYEITIDPVVDLSLTCDMQEVEFQISKKGTLDKDFDGSIEVTTDISQPGKGEWYQAQGAAGDISEPLILYPQQGIAQAKLKSDWIGKIQVTGRIINDDATPAVGNFSFVPFKFEVAERALQVVAGKPRDITITAKSCSEPDRNDIAVGYTGKRSLDLSTQYIVPIPETGDTKHPIELRTCTLNDLSNPNSECRSVDSNEWQDENITLDFNEGVATAKLRYLDAGNTVLQIADPECSLEKGCEILPKSYSLSTQGLGDWQRLEGTQTVYSRPYTFALCDFFGESSGQENRSGTADGGRAFAMAGEQVSVRVKALAWAEDLPPIENNRLVTTSDAWCKSAPLTEHYYTATAGSRAVTAPLVLSEPAVAHSPTDGKAGGLQYNKTNELSFTFKRNNQVHDAKNGLLIEGLSWAEVGSFWLQADASYLGMDVDRGSAIVGRIYPYHFAVLESDSGTRYPDRQNFVYMDQSFDGQVKVEAQNAFDQPTTNYGRFDPKFLDTVEIEAVDADKTEPGIHNRLTDRVDWSSLKGWGKNWQGAHLSLAWKPFMFLREIAQSAPKISIEDGPYYVDFGVFIKDREGDSCLTDGCTFLNADDLDLEIQYCGADDDCREPRMGVKFGQVDTRYGRMVMEDAAGRADSNIAIPLSVEFWDGSAFVINSDDSVSEHDGRYSCKQIIANSADKLKPVEKSNSHTQGRGEVIDGDTQSGQFVAVPHQRDTKPVEGYREQSRFWQKLVNITPQKVASKDKDISCESGHVGSDDQPWLLYNWRGKGDENPSAVVTFGVYRGNDRIIYRGEKGINTLLN